MHPYQLLSQLNEQQRLAVTHQSGPLLVVAGAGTGKTRVIVHRLAYLLAGDPRRERPVLAITFTNRAGDEIRERVSKLVPDSRRLVISGTFHGLGLRILRRYGHLTEFGSRFNIVTPEQSVAMLRWILKSKQPSSPTIDPRQVRDVLSAYRNGGRVGPSAVDVNELASVYRSRLVTLKAIDLDGLVLESVRLLREHSALQQRLGYSFEQVLVDEYQDTNGPQVALLQLLTGPQGNITAVGDEDQAIYGWRYAEPDVMLHFADQFPNPSILRLEENYRSTRRILGVANELIRHNKKRLGKTLFSRGDLGPKPVVFGAGDEIEESMFVANHIKNLQETHAEDNKVAVLFRLNSQSRSLEEALLRIGIGYRIHGGRRFYDRPEVRNVVDYLRLVAGRHDSNTLSAVLTRYRGIGPTRARSIVNDLDPTSPIESLSDGRFGAPAQLRDSILRVMQEIKRLDPRTHMPELVRELGRLTLRELAATTATPLEKEVAEANVEELVSAAAECARNGGSTLEDFLDQIDLSAPQTESSEVQLMTLHAAKGLEFDVVFIVGLEEGSIPHRRTLSSSEDPEEERRLLYVGMTRAKKRLYLTYSRIRSIEGRLAATQPSRFLDEIPARLLEFKHSTDKKPRERLARVRVGERVAHPRWGVGIVEHVEGGGRKTMVSISFEDGSRQRVQLQHAPLKRVS